MRLLLRRVRPVFVLEPGTRPLGLEGLIEAERPLLLIRGAARTQLQGPRTSSTRAYQVDGEYAELMRLLDVFERG